MVTWLYKIQILELKWHMPSVAFKHDYIKDTSNLENEHMAAVHKPVSLDGTCTRGRPRLPDVVKNRNKRDICAHRHFGMKHNTDAANYFSRTGFGWIYPREISGSMGAGPILATDFMLLCFTTRSWEIYNRIDSIILHFTLLILNNTLGKLADVADVGFPLTLSSKSRICPDVTPLRVAIFFTWYPKFNDPYNWSITNGIFSVTRPSYLLYPPRRSRNQT